MYIQQAYKGSTEWWRYLTVFLMVFLLNFVAGIPVVLVGFIKKMNQAGDVSEFASTLNPMALGLSQNSGLLLLLAPFIVVFIGLVFVIVYVHRIGVIQVFTSFKRYRWKHFFYAAAIWFILLALADIIYYFNSPDAYKFHFEGGQFFWLLIISLLFFPFQAGWEELYFRGNLLQGLALLTRYRWIAIIATSIAFGLVHATNPEVKEYGMTVAMAQYMGFGLLLGIIVVMDGGLEMALGVHIVNNIYASVFVSYSGSLLNTPSMFSSHDVNKVFITLAFFSAAILYLLLAKRNFKWKSFRWIFSKIETP